MTGLPPLVPVGEGWRRLDRRMLLVHPIREVVKFLPALVGLFLAGTSGGLDLRFQLLGIAFPVLLGVLRYLTTAYRIGPERVELRRGLVNRHQLSTRRDRVRTVDLTSSPAHRLLGLSSVRIGTGTAGSGDDSEIELDALPTAHARGLRLELLAAAVPSGSSAPERSLDPSQADDPEPDAAVLELDPRWARFAPLTSTGFVLTGAALGVGSQVLQQSGGGLPEVRVDDPRHLLWLVPTLAASVLVAVVLIAVGGYLVQNWGFTLSRGGVDGSWHLRRGLLTTRETTIDDERVGGVAVGEPLGLRLAGGARLDAIVTGLDRERQGSSLLVPPAPRAEVERTASVVLGTPRPVTGELRPHGPAAVRRRWTRAVAPAAVLCLALGGLVVAGAPWWLTLLGIAVLLTAAVLAADRARALGHALDDGYVVARSGSLLRRREALATAAVIGWTFRSTWLQRRAGLTTLVATTAGGRQRVVVPDVPEADAVRLADAAVPGLVGRFVLGASTGEPRAETD